MCFVLLEREEDFGAECVPFLLGGKDLREDLRVNAGEFQRHMSDLYIL